MPTITTHTAPAVEPHIAHQGEARWYGDSLFEFLIPNDATGGALSVLQATMPGGFSPPRHIHTREDEVFVVLDGDVCFEIDGRRLLAGPGTSVSCRAVCRTRSGLRARLRRRWGSWPPDSSSNCSAT